MSYPSSTPHNNPLAMTSALIVAVAYVFCFMGACITFFIFTPLSLCFVVLFLCAMVAATITGYRARQQIQASGGVQMGDGFALIGMVMGGIGIGLSIIILCIAVFFGSVLVALLGSALGNGFSNILTATPLP